MIAWVERQHDLTSNDLIVIAGDFNANPDSGTYKLFESNGYKSVHKVVHGKEPNLTFPTGLKAPWMDEDPAGTFDYIFIKGKHTVNSAKVTAT